jgi:hypothetical protein
MIAAVSAGLAVTGIGWYLVVDAQQRVVESAADDVRNVQKSIARQDQAGRDALERLEAGDIEGMMAVAEAEEQARLEDWERIQRKYGRAPEAVSTAPAPAPAPATPERRIPGVFYPEDHVQPESASSSPALLAAAVAGVGGMVVFLAFGLIGLRLLREEPDHDEAP